MTPLEPDRKILRRRLSKLGREDVELLLELQKADMGSKGTGDPEEREVFGQVRQILDQIYQEDACLTLRDLAVDGADLIALGYAPGKALGACLQRLLDQVVDEILPNEKAALLEAAGKELEGR